MAGKMFGITNQAVSQGWRRLFPGVEPPWQRAIRDALREVREAKKRSRIEAKNRKLEKVARAAQLVIAGASIPEVCAELGLSYHSTREQLRQMGIRSSASGRTRMDGRIYAAIAAIKMGVPVAEACRRARCAPQGVVKTMRRQAGERIP